MVIGVAISITLLLLMLLFIDLYLSDYSIGVGNNNTPMCIRRG